MNANPLLSIIAVLGIIFAGSTVFLGTRLRQKKAVKYIPAILAALVSVAFAVKAFWFSEGFEGLGYVILLMISAAVFILSAVTALVLEFVNHRKNK
jgi:hypothetical protein